jgi:hypothetical protein
VLSRLRALKDRYRALIAEYGKVAVVTYFSIFGLVLAGFYLAIQVGLSTGEGGALLAAYLATKATQPLRILATLALTPPIAIGVRRIRG